MIDSQNFRTLLVHLGFEQDHSSVTTLWRKRLGPDGALALAVDFGKEEIIYAEAQGLNVHQRQTCNFAAAENAVVFECVYRLLDKGYKPEHIELEPEWSLGHGSKSGRADILVRDQQGAALLIIECKTTGREFNKAWKDTLADGAQLFSYVEQEKATQFICLYASEWDAKAGTLHTFQEIVSVKDNPQILQDNPGALSFAAASNARERFKVWKETYAQESTQTGIFEGNILPYQIGKNKYTLANDTKPLKAIDIKGAYHRFRTVLRKHNVSRRENAFEVLVNLFVCKIVDETENPNDLKFYWKGIAYDNYFDLVDRLQSLYKTGMSRFLGQDIVYVSNDDIENAFWPVKNQRSAVREEIRRLFRQLKFFKGLDFEFIKVFNQTYFDKNAKILIEIIQMWQGLRLTGSSQNQFLGDMFEYFLDNGIKQSEGQFFTPVPICKFIVSALPLERLIADSHEPLRAIDYACGSGHFLTEYAAQLPALLHSVKQQDDARPWFSQIYGIEKEDRLAKVAKVSAFMYGFNDVHILDADALVQHPDIAEEGHDVLVANPPFAVEDFLQTVPEQERQRYTLLDSVNDLGNKNVQCFFLERAQQLLKPSGVVGVIVPSSILSNTDGMHVATRQILLQYFDFVAITELGGSTFGKTGTNTVVLFLRRKPQRPEPALHFSNRSLDFFDDWARELAQEHSGEYLDLNDVRHYCAHVGLEFEAYQGLLRNAPEVALLDTEPFKDYRRAFDESNHTKKLRASKDFGKKPAPEQEAELHTRFVAYCRQQEQTKLYYYLLAHRNPTPVLLIKGPSDNKEQQQFLGYEWSGAKGQEGIRYAGGDSVHNIVTPLFDPQSRDNTEKLSYLVRQNFDGQPVVVPDSLQAYVTQTRLVDLLEFGRVEFDAAISLSSKNSSISVETQWPLIKIGDIFETASGGTPLSTESQFYKDGKIPWVNSGEVRSGLIISTENHITELGLKNSSAKIFPKNTVLVAMYGATAGQVGILGIEASTNQAVCGIFPNEKVYSVYLFNFLSTQLDQLLGLRSGIARLNLSQEKIRNFRIPVPPLNIQQQIVAECEAVDKAVEQAQTDIQNAQQAIADAFATAAQAAHREVRLANVELFDIFIGKRVLKSQITSDTSATPVYSANVLSPFGYTHNRLIEDFSRASVLWGIDGDWMVNLIPANAPFYPTDHCGVVRVKAGADIHPRYLAMALEQEGRRVRFSRSNRAKTEAIRSLKLLIPDLDLQQNLDTVATQAEAAIAAAQTIIDAAPAQKQAILQNYL
ncbi:restriction endonuclease subunit S [Macromonas bipunctata]|uniref:restriction endonuclease subunit S n=1 Tax=Macromonas bipunctata TaxID=183670 RepID=UPI000C34F7ED|nr:restriction endonuclease subunit S [Macromonas bipunctata]